MIGSGARDLFLRIMYSSPKEVSLLRRREMSPSVQDAVKIRDIQKNRASTKSRNRIIYRFWKIHRLHCTKLCVGLATVKNPGDLQCLRFRVHLVTETIPTSPAFHEGLSRVSEVPCLPGHSRFSNILISWCFSPRSICCLTLEDADR
jgi:hypothetical protein